MWFVLILVLLLCTLAISHNQVFGNFSLTSQQHQEDLIFSFVHSHPPPLLNIDFSSLLFESFDSVGHPRGPQSAFTE